VRARNLGVPFLVCFDDTISENLMKVENKFLGMKIVNQSLEILENFTDGNNGNNFTVDKKSIKIDLEEDDGIRQVQSVSIPDGFPKIIIHMNEFSKQYVGAKSNNTKKVFGNLPTWVKYPESLAIPFNVCEYFLDFDENTHIKEKLEVK
jgi:hypothetical protein